MVGIIIFVHAVAADEEKIFELVSIISNVDILRQTGADGASNYLFVRKVSPSGEELINEMVRLWS